MLTQRNHRYGNGYHDGGDEEQRVRTEPATRIMKNRYLQTSGYHSQNQTLFRVSAGSVLFQRFVSAQSVTV